MTKLWAGHEHLHSLYPYKEYVKFSSARCDLDLGPSDMVLARDTSSLYDDHSCQFILKSHHAQQSYEPDTNIYIHYIHIRNMWNFQVPAVTLTLDRATWFLHATRRLDMMIIHADLFRNPIMHNKVMSRTRKCPIHTNKQTHTHKHTHKHTYKHTHTQTHARTPHAHAHTHIHMLSYIYICI